jgi:chaperonin GroES
MRAALTAIKGGHPRILWGGQEGALRQGYLTAIKADRLRSVHALGPAKDAGRAREGEQAMKGFRPLHDRVLVRRIEAEEKTPGGILIPDTAKEKPVEGEVLAVGPGGRDEAGRIIPLDVRVGDRMLFGKWSGTDVLIGGEERLILKESDVLGVVEEKRRSAKAT